ncbi:DUF4432 family protein [Kribbella pittospori]|uniref:DUF4432 family protein n=1 Tax=Kribbella pittospori TaxID=722689 RepID=A0A4R0KKD1_9ACTN|nr:DUF4432 family protein [Kribbella pittospori]TCC61131.1 DUF4432 family protein [Kribbella pittospori]
MTEPPPDATLVLRNEHLEVVVLPGKGADIYSVIDRRTGVDVLFRTPWGWRDPATITATGDSQVDWLARYPGGWQLLVPNAGPEREHGGVRRGFHGEAALVGWAVEESTPDSARLTVDLVTAPLRLVREIVLDGMTLVVTDHIRNTSPVTVPVMCVQHAGFGAPFLDGHCRLETSARHLVVADGYDEIADLQVIPGPDDQRSFFAGLTGFDDAWVSISSPTVGFGVRLSWDSAVLPHAWLWQEVHRIREFPWFGRAYVVGVEPSNVLPDDDLAATPLLPAGEEWHTRVTLTRFDL